MERFFWIGHVVEGKLDEYIKRHDEIWPEMTELLNEAGVHNYTIWNNDHELYGYYECESVEHALKVQNESPIVERWNKYMEDVMHMYYDKEGKQILPHQIFLHK